MNNYIEILIDIIEKDLGQTITNELIENYISTNHKDLIKYIQKGDYEKIANKINERGADLGAKIGILN